MKSTLLKKIEFDGSQPIISDRLIPINGITYQYIFVTPTFHHDCFVFYVEDDKIKVREHTMEYGSSTFYCQKTIEIKQYDFIVDIYYVDYQQKRYNKFIHIYQSLDCLAENNITYKILKYKQLLAFKFDKLNHLLKYNGMIDDKKTDDIVKRILVYLYTMLCLGETRIDIDKLNKGII